MSFPISTASCAWAIREVVNDFNSAVFVGVDEDGKVQDKPKVTLVVEGKRYETTERALLSVPNSYFEGLLRQRAFIESYFPFGSALLSLDDDIDQLYKRQGKRGGGAPRLKASSPLPGPLSQV